MSVEIHTVYEGGLRCMVKHGPSGNTLLTDAPKDNMGKGESFSPTDLMAAALGSCLVTIMGIVAKGNDLDISGTRVHVEKHMQTKPVRRIASLPATITIPADKARHLADDEKEAMEAAALSCPVHKSLHPDIDSPVRFVYEE